MSGNRDTRQAPVFFPAAFDAEHFAGIDASRKRAWFAAESTHPCDRNVVECDFLVSKRQKETESIYGESKRPKVFSVASGLGADVPQHVRQEWPAVAEAAVLADLDYHGTAVTPFDAQDVSGQAQGLTISRSGSESILQNGVPGCTRVGMRLRLGLPVDTGGGPLAPSFAFGHGRRPPRSMLGKVRERGIPDSKITFVAKEMSGHTFASMVAENLALGASDPTMYARVMNDFAHKNAPLESAVHRIHNMQIHAGLQMVYDLLKAELIIIAPLGAQPAPITAVLGGLGGNPDPEALVNRFALMYGLIAADENQPAGGLQRRELWDARRQELLMRINYTPRFLLQGYGMMAAQGQYNPVDARGQVKSNAASGQMYLAQLSAVANAIGGFADFKAYEERMYIGTCVTASELGRKQNIVR